MDGEIVKKSILKTIEEIFPDKMYLFNVVGLLVNTIARPTTDHKNDNVR